MSFYLDNNVSVEKRLNDPRNILSQASFKSIGQGQHKFRGTGPDKPYRKLSPETKGLVAALAQVSGTKETSKALGVPVITTQRLKAGMTTDGTKADPELRKETKSVLDSIGVQASNLVQVGLQRLLNPQRLDDAKTTELAQIVSVAMGVVEKTKPATSFVAGRVVFMVPESREVNDYSVIDVVPIQD